MYDVLVTARSFGRFSQQPYELLEQAGCRLLDNPWQGRKLTEEELLKIITGAEALICGEEPVTARVMDAAPTLRVISKFGVGIDQIDVAAATARGIAVCNTPGANKESVADMTFALMLGVARQLPRAGREMRAGIWQPITGCALFKKTLGIVGLGNVGKAVARRAGGFSMKIIAFDEYPDEEFAQNNAVEFVALKKLLQEADFVSLHVPAAKGAKPLVGKAELGLMKNTAYLINTARGAVVDEEALYEALKSGGLAGAGLDVFEKEPLGKSPLLDLDNVVTTPHIGAHTVEAVDNVSRVSAQNAIAVLSGLKCEYALNA